VFTPNKIGTPLEKQRMLRHSALMEGMVLVASLGLRGMVWGGDAKTVSLKLPSNGSPVVKKIAVIFERQVTSRCESKVTTSGTAPVSVELSLKPGMGPEGFQIAGGPDGSVRIVGNDERGLLYGVGKF